MIPLTDQMRIVGTDDDISDCDFRLLFLHVIGESKVEVPLHLKLIAKLLDNEQDRLIESYERKLANDRERKRRYRESHAEERGGTRTDTESVPSHTIPANPVNPSIPSSPTRGRFVKPSVEMVRGYCTKQGIEDVDADQFFDYYEANGWLVGKSPMKDWKAAVRNWHRRRADANAKMSPAGMTLKNASRKESDYVL